MEKLIDIMSYPVDGVLDVLLQDKTTNKNIIWATDAYSSDDPQFGDKAPITVGALTGYGAIDLRPRISKSIEEQLERTRKKAEVMTPVWICNKMNNYADEQWFGREDVFNHENADHTWTVTEGLIQFPEGKDWKKYVDSRRLEITCGEAPYLVSRYDTTTGDLIEPPNIRIGMLDRKLRIVNENAATDEEWMKWAERAFESCYGYEYQGDNLLIARINMLMTYYEYYKFRFGINPDIRILQHIAHIIAWNLWQMDGLKDTVPLGKPEPEDDNFTLDQLFPEAMFVDQRKNEETAPYCRIFNWRSNESLRFKDCKEKSL